MGLSSRACGWVNGSLARREGRSREAFFVVGFSSRACVCVCVDGFIVPRVCGWVDGSLARREGRSREAAAAGLARREGRSRLQTRTHLWHHLQHLRPPLNTRTPTLPPPSLPHKDLRQNTRTPTLPPPTLPSTHPPTLPPSPTLPSTHPPTLPPSPLSHPLPPSPTPL